MTARPGLSVELERGDQELRRRDGAKGLERPAELDGKRAGVERELLRQRRAASDAERSATAVGPGRRGWQPPAAEAGRQQPVGDARGSAGARLQLLPELAEPSLELERFALVRERIVARGHVLQERLEQLGAGEHGPVIRRRGARRRSGDERKEEKAGAHLRSGRSGRELPIVRQRERVEAPGGEALPAPAAAARHADLHVDRTRVVSQAEQRPEVALREIAAARADLAELLAAARVDRDLRADREAVSRGRDDAEADPAVARSAAGSRAASATSSMLLTTRSGSPSSSRSPTASPRLDLRDLEPRAGARGNVAKAAAPVQQELVLLRGSSPRARGSRRRPRRCGRWRRKGPAGRRGRRRGRRRPSPCARRCAPRRPDAALASSNCLPSRLR